MTSDVVLSAALRANLLSLQNTQKSIDATQTRLSTGKKVNSALDNPQSFFQAQSLTNRASDLSNLLDSIGQSIQVINAANNGITALTSLVNSAQSLIQSAQTTASGASTTASVTGSVSLNGAASWTSITGLTTGDKIIINVTDPTGGTNKLTNQTVTTVSGDTVNDVITRINDLNTTQSLTTPAISASLDSSGHLTFNAANGGTLQVQFVNGGTVSNTASLSEATALGFAGVALDNVNGTASTQDVIGFTQLAGSGITSKGLYTGTGTLATASTLLSALKDSTNTAITNLTGTSATAETLTIKVGGKTSSNLLAYSGSVASTATVQNLVDAINHDTSISSLVSASFNATTGQLNISPIAASATDVQVQLVGAAGQKFDIGLGNSSLTTAATITTATEDIRFGAASGTLASLQTQYNTIRTQIDQLVNNGDTAYQGTNLLAGNNLTTYFDETSKSSLTTQGVNFTSAGLGISAANFGTSSGIAAANTQITNALNTIRNFGTTLATNLSVIQSRQDFTNNIITTLNTGASNLVNSDQNTDGAELLALQTRQSLGVTALSLASQSQQSILRLFG